VFARIILSILSIDVDLLMDHGISVNQLAIFHEVSRSGFLRSFFELELHNKP